MERGLRRHRGNKQNAVTFKFLHYGLSLRFPPSIPATTEKLADSPTTKDLQDRLSRKFP